MGSQFSLWVFLLLANHAQADDSIFIVNRQHKLDPVDYLKWIKKIIGHEVRGYCGNEVDLGGIKRGVVSKYDKKYIGWMSEGLKELI